MTRAQTMDGKLNINVNIEGVQLPLTVSDIEEEKIYRDAAISIQDRLRKLRDTYSDLPGKYYYVMAMLLTAVNAARTEKKTDTKPFVEMMDDLSAEIDKALGKQGGK